jgi:ABC-type dipeptide/oligopeptide/nickel transport system permease subunit
MTEGRLKQFPTEHPRPRHLVWIRGLWARGRQSPLLIVGLLIFLGLLLFSLVGPLVAGSPVATDSAHVLQPPSTDYFFGTDTYGRDVMARAATAARLDVSIGVVIAILSMTVGSLIGAV